jgi:hypothetical protein
MPRKFWMGLIIILVIYTLFYLFFKDANYLGLIPRKIRHIIKFVVLITIYLVGVWHLSLDKITWMKTLWHLIHISGIVFLVSLGAYDWLINPMPQFMREVMDAVNEFLIGPTLFVGMAILQKFLLKGKEGSTY